MLLYTQAATRQGWFVVSDLPMIRPAKVLMR